HRERRGDADRQAAERGAVGTERQARAERLQRGAQRGDPGLERGPGAGTRLDRLDPRLEQAHGRALELHDLVDHVLPLNSAGEAAERDGRAHGSFAWFRVLCRTPEPAGADPGGFGAGIVYCRSRRTSCGAAFACASIAMPVCCRIWLRVNVVISAAMSASRIVDSAAETFSIAVRTFVSA